MRVIRAEAMGMCFGVRDAIAITETISNAHNVTIHGELVHNEQVNKTLRDRGFSVSGEIDRTVPVTRSVMITAHGVSHRERSRLSDAGKEIIDTTCPLVRRAHDTALRAREDGRHVVIAGKRGHVEVAGLTGDLDSFTIVQSPEEACFLPHSKIGVVCQTTLQPTVAAAITEALRRANPDSDVRLFDTICRPTRERQNAMERLLKVAQAIVVVGGRHSNNTRQLVRLAEGAGLPVCHVCEASEIDGIWAAQFKVIGLTAGTSTPDAVIDAVEARLLTIRPKRSLLQQAYRTVRRHAEPMSFTNCAYRLRTIAVSTLKGVKN